jgi:colanic acid biosynthesis glycosyl transferase WcaI
LKGIVRILILSQYYWPEPIPKPTELAQALRESGDTVNVVTGFPDYPSGQIYSGHHLRLIRRETIAGVQVMRTFEYPYHGTRAIGRFLNYISFMMSAPLSALFLPKIDVIYVWHPPLTIGVAAWLISRIRKVPFVYDVQDIWPEAAVLSGMLKPGLTVRCLSILERFVYNRADHLITVTEGARANLMSKGVSAGKVSVLPHWFAPEPFAENNDADRERIRAENDWEDKFVVLFAGNLGLVQGLDTIVNAADLLRNEARIRIVFVGDGADKARLVKRVCLMSLEETVQFIERQAIEKMPGLIAASDALLAHLKKSELSNYVIPTKTLAYLAGGRPIVMAMQGAASDLVHAAGAGITVPPEDPLALANGIRELSTVSAKARTCMGNSGRSYLRSHFSKDVVVPEYRKLLKRVIAERVCRK